ncbi:carbohydrate-binding module family 50 protein [Teratosphaeria destructans]|uniref:Carbohydrate-binding module family 50 protein n=1 Tax=Teratosphaeria destructans TaxID=418781 RepID=A0A9W7SMQ2_9PEZI|nr:carbohydrate-binding module family 50 protein [Teratosphaeria destructans]
MDAKGRKSRARQPFDSSNGLRSASSGPPTQWGPAPTSTPTVGDIGAGTKEEQLAALRAQKRKNMLLQQESSYADALGRFKRRSSDDHASISAPPGDGDERDALVYVHPVQKSDTLAGITIKYNCSANTIRKANRMWPNDTVQMRPIIILPVDACGVKGRPVPGPEAIDLLTTETDALEAGQAEEVPAIHQPPAAINVNGNAFNRNRTNSASTNASRSRRPSSSAAASSLDTQPPWHHDSWVMLPGSMKPTEIARLSRRALGYFPPTRRKSNCYSDLDTPPTSLDLQRAGMNDVLALCPGRQDPPQRPSRTRRSSNATNGYFPAYLAGPGGVGTMSSNVHFPGPAQDGLNKMFAKHLPDVAPPRHHQSLLSPEMPRYTDDPTPAASGTTTPSFGKNLNLENVGGAIESWMRKMATQTKVAMTPTERQKPGRASAGVPVKGVSGIGDLIEMTDEFEIGVDDEDDDNDRGRKGSAAQPASSATSYFDGVTASRRSKSGHKQGKDD